MLRTLSHEIRTPLARLKIASDSGLPPEQLQQRLSREVEEMRRLVDDSLNLAWLDTEKPRLEGEEVVVASVWEALVQDAHFETGWPLDALVCELDSTCLLHVHLNSFAQALENILCEAAITPDTAHVAATWQATVSDTFTRATLSVPAAPSYFYLNARRGLHTEHLGILLAEMQFLPRAYPDATW